MTNTCERCPSLVACRTQIVFATPSKEGGLLAIGEAPGADEDAMGEGFVGAAGKTLDRLIAAEGLSRQDYGRANICRCRPPENRKPTKAESNACMPYLADLISRTRPKVILCVGGTPSNVFCGKGSLAQIIADRELANNWAASLGESNAHPLIQGALKSAGFVVPMPHTSPLAFNRNAPSGEKWAEVAKRQVRLAVSLLDRKN